MHVGVNLLVLNARPPGGTGHHAISLFEALVEVAEANGGKTDITGFVAQDAVGFFSARARRLLKPLQAGRGQRIVNELMRLPAEAKRAGVDVVVNPAFFGAPWSGSRRALIIHDLYFRSDPLLVPWRRRMLLRMVVPVLGHASDLVFTVSEATRTQLVRFYPSLGRRARVLHNGNRVLGNAPMLADRPIRSPYLLMVGHLSANKSPETVIAALAALRREGRNIELLHIGDDGGRLAPLAAAAGVTSSVIALGRQSDDVLAAHYAHCVALVMPSIREGFGLPLIEAQAYGAPVVASTCEALTEVAGDAALFFPVDDPAACAAMIRRISDTPALRHELIERGRVNAAQFRWDRTATQLLDELTVGGA